VRIGTRLRLRAADGSERLLTILGPWESKPEAAIVSYESEAAVRLIGKRPGDQVTWDGEAYSIAAIEAAV
jgi:transcription elongation GreA/GreB family factor